MHVLISETINPNYRKGRKLYIWIVTKNIFKNKINVVYFIFVFQVNFGVYFDADSHLGEQILSSGAEVVITSVKTEDKL